MAKWEERDPRWVVTEREDGVNVGGWHWEERDRLPWAKDRVPALLAGVATPCGVRVASAAVTAGDCYTSVRKGGKRFSHYDLTLRVSWERDGGDGGRGDVTVSEWSSDGDDGDVLVDGDAAVAAALRGVLLAALAPFREEMDALEW